MTFLGFRHAHLKRKAKKSVNARPPRSPTPSSGSFVTTSVVEIGDPTSASAEACLAPVALHLDVDFAREPLFPSNEILSTFRQHSPTTNPRESKDRLSRSRLGGNSSRPLHHNAARVQPRDSSIAGSPMVRDVIQTQDFRRTAKVAPTPIKIPTTYHACKLEIPRPAGKSAEHSTSLKPGDSPVLEDTASAVSGISLPATLIVSGWTAQTDQSRDRHLSRRITRLDSATLPVDPFLQQYSDLSNGDRESHVPPVPLSVGASPEPTSRHTTEQAKGDVDLVDKGQLTGEGDSCDQLLPETTVSEVFNAYKSLPTSLIVELPTPDPSDSATPDLIKDSSTSTDGGSSDAQPNTSSTSGSASSTWSGPRYSSSPASVGKFTKILDVFPATPSNPKLPSEQSNALSLPSQAGLPTGERNDRSPKLLARQRRTCATPEFRRLLSRSSPRPSLASVNVLLLHPATLRPVSEGRTSHSSRRSTAGSHVADPDDADSLSAKFPSSLPTTCPQDLSQLPSFPETAANPSAATSSGFPSSSSPPSSPDFLDSIILAEESRRTRQRRISRESISTMPVSGSTQTFPETPPIFSPMFSSGFGHPRGHTLSILDSSTRQHASLKRHNSRGAQKLISGRSASAKASMGTTRKKSWRSNLKRSSTASTPGIHSLLSTATSCDTTTTMKSDEAQFVDDLSTHPKSVSSEDPSDPEYFQRPALHKRSKFPKKTPASPSSQPPSPRATAVKSESNSTSPSLFSLPPPPPPPQLQLPLPLVSRVPAVSPSSLPCGLPPSPTIQARPPSVNIPSEDKLQASISLAPPPPVARVYNSLASHSTSPFRVPVNLPLNAYNTDRPPRPLGPRPPYRNESFSSGSRGRFPSNSSTESFPGTTVTGNQDPASGNSSACSGSSSEPRFQTSPAKFKALTMDAARWILSQEELHALVTQAIRGSGRASSIRLLSQQAAGIEIPQELGRLNALLDELTVQYRLQVRKRNVLLRATLEYAESPEPCSAPFRSNLQELHETALNLDRIAEEMYHARDQAAQLSRMLAVHSGSALAMALRNLHSSYVRRTADVQSLKDHVSALEVECDEAWAQAQQVARDLDDLNSTLQTDSSPSTRHTSHSSSRIVASRQSNLRFSRMGLRSSAASRRASLASPIDSTHLSCVSAVSSSSGITRRLSSLNRIITSGLSSHSSEMSSSSGKRALAQAQADLYKYLGIDDRDDPESMPRPARRSFVMASPSTTMSPVARDDKEKALRRMSDITDHRMTRGSGLCDRFQAFMKENEPNASDIGR